MEPKWLQKSMKKIVDFWIAPGRALGRQGRPAQVWNARGEDHGEVSPLLSGKPPLATSAYGNGQPRLAFPRPFFALPFRPCLGLKRPRLGLPWPCLSRPFLTFSRPCLALPLPSHFQYVLSMILGRFLGCLSRRFLTRLGKASSKRDPSSSPPLPMKSEVGHFRI